MTISLDENHFEANEFRKAVFNFYNRKNILNFSDNSNFIVHINRVLNSIKDNLNININHSFNSQPACRHLENIFNNPSLNNLIIKKLYLINYLLNWKVNENYRNVYPQHFFENESFVEIIGPNGLLLASDIRVGFLLMGKNVFYPSHSHEALELYNIIIGKSLWQINFNNFEEKDTNDIIFHDIWEPHAMKTIDETVLALFSWSGNITSEAIPIK